jgi:hypothetical protein
MSCELALRFDYGSAVPWVTRLDDGALRAIAGPDMTVLVVLPSPLADEIGTSELDPFRSSIPSPRSPL